MKEIQDGHLLFVSRHFEPGALKPRKAWRSIRKRISCPSWRLGYSLALAGAIAAVLLGVFIFTSDRYNRTVISADATAKTAILPDRSQVTLAPGSSLSFHKRHFAHKDRDVRMSGKLYYDVERNEALPFTIYSSEAVITVLGTCFQVEENLTCTSVDVISGRVRFASASDGGDAVELTRGMHAELPAGGVHPEVTTAAALNPAAWATHHFIYDDAPLEDVLDELSAVFGRKASCTAQGRRLSGEFSADSLEDAVSLIEATLDVKVTLP